MKPIGNEKDGQTEKEKEKEKHRRMKCKKEKKMDKPTKKYK